MKIAVSGATGFIGSALVDKIIKNTDWNVVGLSRREGESQQERLEMRPCDLYNLGEVNRGLAGCDIGIYLVHSMLKPTSRLVQGNFHDFDFILADNFARAAARNNLKLIIYVSGIVPHDKTDLSLHLASRLEVEKTLNGWGVPVLTLRSGLVIGPNGSSFRILQRLVERLPLLVLPSWMKNSTQVVFINDLLEVILRVLQKPPVESKSFDVVHPEILTYRELLQRTVKALGLKRKMWYVPLIPLWVSKFWVCIITGVPKQLVYPLIESLEQSMLARFEKQLTHEYSVDYTSIDESLLQSVKETPLSETPTNTTTIKWKDEEKRINEVQSVQRLPLPGGWSASDVAEHYSNWISRFFRSLLNVKKVDDLVIFYFVNIRFPLLKLRLRDEPEFKRRRAFDVVGGWLVFTRNKGWLEFREGTNNKTVFASIYRYRPRLPWLIYRYSQALLHAWVMANFAKELERHRLAIISKNLNRFKDDESISPT